jgi:RNA polymerase sigma-70 factor (ECF subfamily)
MTWPPALPFSSVLSRARSLDAQAISLLYRRFLPVVYRYVLARVGDCHTAEDLTSDTFMALVESIEKTRAHDELTFAAWLLGIARNTVAQHFRRRSTRPEAALSMTESDEPRAYAEEGDPLAIITARESWSEVVQALNKLTEDQRTVILYRCVLGYSTEDVAQLMSKQPGTVRALQFRALTSLSRHLEAPRVPYEPGARQRGRRSR